jgi:hypothetical protein
MDVVLVLIASGDLDCGSDGSVSRILREKRWSSRTWIRILMRRLPRSMSVCRVLMVAVSAHTRDYFSEALILAD